MHWFKNGEYCQCCRGWPSEESRGWGWDAFINRAEEEELQWSLGFCQTDPLADCGFLPLLIPLPHYRVCLLLHHSMSCQTTVSYFLEQNFPRSRFAQVQLSLVGWLQNCGKCVKTIAFFHSNLWLFSYWRYKLGQGQRYPLCSQKFWRQSEQYVHWSRYDMYLTFNNTVGSTERECVFI